MSDYSLSETTNRVFLKQIFFIENFGFSIEMNSQPVVDSKNICFCSKKVYGFSSGIHYLKKVYVFYNPF